jgi:hypothetical protein
MLDHPKTTPNLIANVVGALRRINRHRQQGRPVTMGDLDACRDAVAMLDELRTTAPHAPEPWRAYHDGHGGMCLDDADGRQIGFLSLRPDQEATAARLISVINALAGEADPLRAALGLQAAPVLVALTRFRWLSWLDGNPRIQEVEFNTGLFIQIRDGDLPVDWGGKHGPEWLSIDDCPAWVLGRVGGP